MAAETTGNDVPPEKPSEAAGEGTPDSEITIPADKLETGKASAAPKKKERTPTMGDYLRVFSYATKWDFLIYAIASIASISSGVTLPLMNVIFGQLVGQFSSYFQGGVGASASEDDFNRLLDRQALYVLALFVARWGLSSVNKFCFRMIGIRLSSAVRLHYLRALFAQSVHAIDSMPAGAPATAITTTANTLQLGISERLGTFLQSASTVVAAVVVAFVWSWQLTLVTSTLIVYIVVVIGAFLPAVIKGHSASLEADARSTAVASEALGVIRLVMASGAQAQVIARYDESVGEAKRAGQSIAPLAGGQYGLIFFGVFGAFGLAFWYGTKLFVEGAVANAGVVVVVLLSVMMILTSLQFISQPLMAIAKAMVAACEFFIVIDAPLPANGTEKPSSGSKDLVFKDVTFAYPSRPAAKVLDSLSIRIPAGMNTALVGSSGSGKSTIVSLLERWYSLSEQPTVPDLVQAAPPKPKQGGAERDGVLKTPLPEDESEQPACVENSGFIMLGDHDLADLDVKWWRTQIGLVQQEPFLFNDTIYENVSKGLIGTEWEDESEERKRELVKEACEEAHATEFINRLPDLYDTRIGDGGAKLSGGQKQRLAIARSIIKRPQIVILDEATSAIDVKGERIVQAALERITKNRTTITIAHRLSTIKKADRIIVLKEGRAIEEGTHQSLMGIPSGAYSSMVKAQSLRLGTEDETRHKEESNDEGFISDDLPEDFELPAAEKHNAKSQSWRDKAQRVAGSFLTLIARQRSNFPWYVATLATSMAVSAATPIQAWLFAKVIGVFILPSGAELLSQASFWGLMWLALAAGVGVAYFLEVWVGLRLQYAISAVYKTTYLTDVLYQRLPFFDRDENSHGTLSFRISGDAKQLEEMLGLNLAFFFNGIFTIIGCVIIAVVFNWKLGLVSTFVTLPIMIAAAYLKLKHERTFDELNSAIFMESSQFATEAIGAIRTVSSLTMEPAIDARYRLLLDGHVATALRKAPLGSLVFGFAESASLGAQALTFWYGGHLLSSGQIPVEAFFVVFMAVQQGAESAGQALAVAPNAAQASAAANRILDIESTADALRTEDMSQAVIPRVEEGIAIEMRDVNFKYATRDVPIFAGLNLSIKRGQYAALVGPSGCGKSTIISLLERFYDLSPPDSDSAARGEILANGVNINALNPYAYRRHLSLVDQEPKMFQGTFRDNILFGAPDASGVSDGAIHAAAREAAIHDFIVSLPQGYDTPVGQRGVSMSGGQKQRLAVARALLRDPALLLLDEATSALDSESERSVQAAIERARGTRKGGRTMVVVAHRLSTVQNADVIFVFEGGKVVERGTHGELLGLRGTYWAMCQSQALDQ